MGHQLKIDSLLLCVVSKVRDYWVLEAGGWLKEGILLGVGGKESKMIKRLRTERKRRNWPSCFKIRSRSS